MMNASLHPTLLRWTGWVAVSTLAGITVLARALTPTHLDQDADLVPILVGTRGGRALVDKVHRYVPTPGHSRIEDVRWTTDGLLVSVRTAGPRVVVLLDAEGQATVTHARGAMTVHLPLPGTPSSPPYTITVLRPRGPGGVLDARAVPVAPVDGGGHPER